MLLRVIRDLVVGAASKTDIADINGLETIGPKPWRERTGKILIDQERRAYLTARTCSSAIAAAA